MTISYSGNFFRLLARWKGSIWKSVWKELLAFLVLYYGVRLFYTDVIPLIEDEEDREVVKHTFEAVCRMFDNYTKLIPLTFLLGFYVSNVVSRWWRQFECLSWPEDILSILCAVIPGQDETSQRRRHCIARYLNLTSALAWRDVSSKIRLRFPTVKHLVHSGLLTEKEYNQLEEMQVGCGTIRWLTPLHWVQQILQDEIKDNNPMTSLVNNFTTELKIYRQSFRKIYCYDWVCVPLVYTQVAALATYAFFFFCLFGRQFIHDGKRGFTVDLKIPIFTIVQFLFFIGWFKVGQDLMRPFGLDDDDIELNYILDRNIATSFSIVNKLQMTSHPDLDDNDDIFWKERQNPTPEVPHTIFSRQISEHPPKLHAYIRVNHSGDGEDVESTTTCRKMLREKKHINW